MSEDGIEPPTRMASTCRSTTELFGRIGAVSGGRSRASALATPRATVVTMTAWSARDGFEPPNPRDGVYSAAALTACILAEIGCGRGSRTLLKTACIRRCGASWIQSCSSGGSSPKMYLAMIFILVPARGIEPRRHAPMKSRPSHLAQRANWSGYGVPPSDILLPREVLFSRALP